MKGSEKVEVHAMALHCQDTVCYDYTNNITITVVIFYASNVTQHYRHQMFPHIVGRLECSTIAREPT